MRHWKLNTCQCCLAETYAFLLRASEAGELAAAFERERDTINSQIAELAAQRDSLSSENAALRDSLSKAEAAAGKHASLAEEVAELRRYLAAAEEAAAAGADAVAENDSLGSRWAGILSCH